MNYAGVLVFSDIALQTSKTSGNGRRASSEYGSFLQPKFLSLNFGTTKFGIVMMKKDPLPID